MAVAVKKDARILCSYGVLDWLQKELRNGRFRLGEKWQI